MNNLQFFLYLIITLTNIQSQTYTVGLNSSLLLNQNYAGITTIGKDLEGNFLVGFANGQARKYVPNFTAYTAISVPEPVDQFNTRSVGLSSTLSNGTSINISDRRMVTKSNGYRTVRGYNYYNFTNIENYSVNETIQREMGFPIKVGLVSHCFYVLVCDRNIYVMFRGATQTTLALSTYFGPNITCMAANFYQYPLSMQGDYFNATFRYYISFSDGSVYRMVLDLSFKFNFTVSHYDFNSISLDKTLIYTAPSPITYLSIANNMLMMQSNSTGQTAIYNTNTNTLGTVSGIPLNETFNFFYINSTYYILQSTGLAKLTYSSTSNTMGMNFVTSVLPYNSYGLNFGSAFDPFYIPGLPYLYKASSCPGNALMVGSVCVNYNCSVANCLSCPINSALCSTCITGFMINGSQCSPISIIAPIINTTSLNSSNSVSNNSTNTSSNNANTSSNTNTANDTSSQLYFSTDSNPFLQQSFFNELFNILGFLISIPTARRVITPVFFYFGIFDDIYLFQFHDRVYGSTMKGVFSTINDIQNKKWSLINYQEVLDLLGVESGRFNNDTDYQLAYENYHFKDGDHADVGPEGLWSNCQNFFIVNLPITVVVFIIFRLIFKALFKFSISRWIRKFQFWSLLFLLLFDGSIQQFAFYQVTDWKNMFAFSFFTKLVKIQTIYFGFILALVSIGLIFVSYAFYKKLNKHLMSNNRNDFFGQISLMLQIGIRNFILGLLHSVLRSISYYHMLSLLLSLEILFAIGFLASISTHIYQSKFKMWIYFLANLAKMVLMVTFYVDYKNINISIVQTVQVYLVYFEISIFCIGIFHESFYTVAELIKLFKKNCKQTNSKKQNNTKEPYLKKALSYKGASVYIIGMNQEQLNMRSKQSEAGLITRRQTSPNFMKKKTRKPGPLKTALKKQKKEPNMTLRIKFAFD